MSPSVIAHAFRHSQHIQNVLVLPGVFTHTRIFSGDVFSRQPPHLLSATIAPYAAFRLAGFFVAGFPFGLGPSIALNIAVSAKWPCCKLWRTQWAFSFALVPFEIRTNVSRILVLMGRDGNTRFRLITACPHQKVVLARRNGPREGNQNMTGQQIFTEELRKRRLWSRGATNAIVILQTLITEDCTMTHRLKMIDLMCHIDGVIWI